MGYAAYAAQPEYEAPLDDRLGFASRKGVDVALARGRAGEQTIDENQYRIEARAAEERRQQQLAEMRNNSAPQVADQQNEDGAPQQIQQQPPAAQQRMAMNPALKGPAGPSNV